jgi:hypothetical protein
MRRPARWLRSRLAASWRDERGAAAVEFALVMPLLILLLFGIIEFARVWNARQTLTDAAREGARIAVVNYSMLNAAVLDDSVKRVVRRAAGNAGLDITEEKLVIGTIGVGGVGGSESAQVSLQYEYTPLFGLVLKAPITMRTSAVMRNEQ